MKKIIPVLLLALLVFSCGGDVSTEQDISSAEKEMSSGLDGAAVERDLSMLLHETSGPDSDPAVIREPFDLSATTVNYFSADSLPEGTLDIADDGRPLSIEEWGPKGQLPRENKVPVIHVSFSHAMVPLSRLGAPMTDHPAFSISPSVEGTIRWYGTRMLSFEPSEPLRSQEEYRVTIAADITSLGSKSLGEDFEFSFTTEALDIAAMQPGTYDELWADSKNVPPTHSGTILLSFTEPVDMEHIKSFIAVKSQGREFSFSIARPESAGRELDENYISRTVQLSLSGTLPDDSDVQVILNAGAASKAGLNGRENMAFRSFHTLIPFTFERQTTYSHSFPRSRTGTINPVFITLSQPIDENGAVDFISTSFGPLEDRESKVEIWNNIIRINDLPVAYGETYQITLGSGLKDVYGQSLGQDKVIPVKVPEADHYAYFPGGSVYRDNDYNYRMLEAEFDPRIIYEYQNIDDGSMFVSGLKNPYVNKNAGELEALDFSEKTRNAANYEIMDLSPWLGEEGFGSVQLNWDFKNPSTSRYARDYRQNLVVQVTDIGLTLRYAYNKVLIWANSLSTGRPLPGAEVAIKLGGMTRTMTTDPQGLAAFELSGNDHKNLYDYSRYSLFKQPVTVSVNGDRADFIPSGTHSAYHFGVYSRSGPWAGADANPVAFFFTDRGLYKPGEKVTFRGIDWDVRLGEFEAFEGVYSLEVKKQDYRSKPFHEIRGTTTSGGGFYGEFELPGDLEPGTYELRYKRSGENRYKIINFTVANFRRLNFQVKSAVPDRMYYQGDTLAVPVEASYLAGGSMANAAYRYFWTSEPSYFRPEGSKYDDWIFGPRRSGGTRNLSHKRGTLNAAGLVRAEQLTGGENIKGQPYLYILETKIEDIDRQEITSRAAVVVHPGDFYIGARLTSGSRGYWSRFVAEGSEQTAQLTLVEPDGTEVELDADIKVELIKRSWLTSQQQGVYGRVNTQYTRVEETVDTQIVKHSSPISELKFTPGEAGSYILRASTEDAKGRAVVTDVNLYATGSSWIRWANSGASDINLIVDKPLYNVGETARILVQSPIPDGDYLMTIEREGIFEEKIISFEGSTGVIELPVTEEHVPVIYLALSSQQQRTGTAESYFDPDLGKPRGYFGLATINVSTLTRELQIEMVPDKPVHNPGEKMDVLLKVTKDGVPVADSEMIFLAVDRGVLDLIGYHVPNPLTHFYDPENFHHAVAGDDSRRLLLDPVTYDISELQGGDGEKLKRREDFVPLAVFEPYLKTDGDGIARVSFELPDTLTTYRATAIAIGGADIGYSESEFLVQNPINVRTALPRKLRYRDTTIGGIIIQNLDEAEHEVRVSLEAKGLSIGDDQSKTVTLAGNTSYELTYLLMAEQAGDAELIFTVNSDVLNEELLARIEVEQPLVKEAFTTIGTAAIKGEEAGITFAEEAVILPSAVAQGFGGLSIQLDSTRLPLAREPLKRLLEYRLSSTSFLLPYGYHALPGILFPEALPGLLPELARSYNTAGKAYFSRAANYQWSDGGIRISPNSISSSPRASLQTAQLLELSMRQELSEIISGKLDVTALYKYLVNLAEDERTSLYFRSWAAALLSEAGKPVQELITTISSYEDELGLSGYAYLALANIASGDDRRAEELWERMKNFLTPGTQSVDLVETYEATGYFDSEVEQLALILRVASAMGESDDFIRRLTESLGRRIRTERWLNYSDCEAAAIAFGEVFRKESGVGTDFTSKVLLGGKTVHTADFKGVSEAPSAAGLLFGDEMLSGLEQDRPYTLRLEKQGRGQLYYTTTIEYALPSEIVQPRDEGLSVYSKIETLDGVEVSPQELELGETYRCRAHISSNRDRTYLSLSVPVPSGAEILDSTFVTTSSYSDEGGLNSEEWTRETVYGDSGTFNFEGTVNFEYDGWWMHYYRPEMLIYDNEMVYQWEYFYRGERRVSFLFKTTTPGVFPTPPAQGKLLLEPEVFGRTGGELFVIQ